MRISFLQRLRRGRNLVPTVATLMLMVLGSCSWDNQEELYPPEELCDTLDVSFSEDIQPLMSQHCWTCHSNENAPSFARGITLEEHMDVASMIPLIVAVINHEEGFPQMPRGGAKLDTCSIATFEAWMNQGSKDN